MSAVEQPLFIHPSLPDAPHYWGEQCAWTGCVPCDEDGNRFPITADEAMPSELEAWLTDADDTSAAHAILDARQVFDGFDGLPARESIAEWATRRLEADRTLARYEEGQW